MRIIIFYDLPMDDPIKLKQYTNFRKWIISRGYMMIQYSIYVKVINAVTKYKYELEALKTKLPNEGNIRVLIITELQYQNIKMLRGSQNLNEKINNEKRYIKI